jgi:hypothetical protein
MDNRTAYHPAHLDGFTEPASDQFFEVDSATNRHFQVVCSCDSREFLLLLSNRKSVKAICAECHAIITLYDLAFYPAAVKIRGQEEFAPLNALSDWPASVFVRFEYSEPEPDVEFDRNDITWCEILVRSRVGKLVTVFDDETC